MNQEQEDRAVLEATVNQVLGGTVTDWFLIAQVVNEDGELGWNYLTSEGQSVPMSMGLIEWARGMARWEQAKHLEEEYG